MKRAKSILTAAIALVTLSFVGFGCMSKAYAGLIVTYTLSGGTITGTLGGAPFSNKSFTMTVNADPDSFALDTTGGIRVYDQPAAPTMTIAGFSPFTITYSPYMVFLYDYGALVPNLFVAGFGTRDTQLGFAVQGYSTDNPILGPAEIVGSFTANNQTLSTTAGDLVITSISDAGATFTATPIPEPGTWAAMAVFAGGAAFAGWRRRRQKRLSP